MSGQLSDIQINNVLASQVVGRLACTNGHRPYIVPVTYTYDGKYIYGQTNKGAKLNILRKNPNVCFETDIMTDKGNWQSVVVQGKFEELKDEEEKQARAILFNRVFALMTSSTVHTYGHEEINCIDDSKRIRHVMYRIKIEDKTGWSEKLQK